MCGIGGDAFCLFFDAKTQRVHALNGSGCAPAALTLEKARATGGPGGGPIQPGYEMLDPNSAHCVTVPGAAAAWCDASKLFGRKPLAEVLQPAIDLAEGGFPVHPIAAQLWHSNEFQLKDRWAGLETNPGAAALLRPNGAPPKPGEWMTMPELAQTFREVAAHGAHDGFYKGRIAKSIVKALQAKGSVMSEDDLAAHCTSVEHAISAPFAGHTVHQLPPNGSGLVSLLALRILDALPKLPACSGEAERMHRVIEALRLAFADGAEHIADYKQGAGAGVVATTAAAAAAAASPKKASPKKASPKKRKGGEGGEGGEAAAAIQGGYYPPVAGQEPDASSSSGVAGKPTIDALLSDAYTAARAALVTEGAALDEAAAGDVASALRTSTSETVYLTAVDGEGNACSFICSNYMGFGSGIVPPGCGFALHNRGANFNVGGRADHPNLLAPRKRPYHTIIPSMVTDAKGRLVASFGVMGGFMQPQGHVQVLSHLLTRGLDPQAALDQPRLCLEPNAEGELTQPAAMQLPAARKLRGVSVHVEEGVAEAELDKLRAWGHEVVSGVSGEDRKMMGRGQMIVVVREEAREGGGGTSGDGDAGGAEGSSSRGSSPRRKRARGGGERRILWAGSDGRGDGCAMGW